MDNTTSQDQPEVTVTDQTQVQTVATPENADNTNAETTNNAGTPDLTKMNEAQKRAWFAKELETSKIKSRFGMEKAIVLNEDTPQQFHMILRFPGVAIASDIENKFDKEDPSEFFQNAVDNGVIAFPKINNLQFWDEHEGYIDAVTKILKFLDDGVTNKMEQA